MSSSECDMCEDFDMFARAKEGMKWTDRVCGTEQGSNAGTDKLTEIAGQHGTAEKLVSITLSAEGYIHFTVHDSGCA